MATVQNLVDQVLAEGGFDVTTAQALAWLNERHKELVGIARRPETGQATGTWAALVPADAVVGDNVTTLQVDTDLLPGLVAGTISTGLRRTEQRPELADQHEALFREAAEKQRIRVAQRYVSQTAESVQELLNEAVAAEGFDATQNQLLIWFNRKHREMVANAHGAEAGQTAPVFAASLPGDLTAATATSELSVDPDCYSGLIAGVIAEGLRRYGEDPARAEPFDAQFMAAAAIMRRRIKQRYVNQTAENVQELLNEAASVEGFDVQQSQLLIWLNRRHREMVAYARGAEAGQAPATFAAALPADVTAGAAVTALAVDPDCYRGLIAGVIADGLTRVGSEQADRYEAQFREAAERMRVRVAQRYLTETTDSVAALLHEAMAVEGFDATQTQLLMWLNRRHRDMVARSRAYRNRLEVGPTVADTAFYAVTDVVETYNVEVNGVPYSKGRRPDVYANTEGSLWWRGPEGSGFVVEDVNASNVQGFTLIPSPNEAGFTIQVWAAVMPPTVTAADPVSALKVDSDCYDALISGVVATGLLRLGQSPQLAAQHEQMFEAGVEKMRRRVRSRYRTMGPSQIRIVGQNV